MKKLPRHKRIKLLKKKCDILWSKVTKKLYLVNHHSACQWCGKKGALQSDHIVNRWKHSTRWCVENCVCLCVGCHIFRKKREPAEWAKMVIDVKGIEMYEFLLKRGECLEKVDLDNVLMYLERLDKDLG